MSETDLTGGETPATEGRRSRGAGGGASARRQARSAARPVSMPFITRRIEPTDILSAEAVEIIEHNADMLMEEVGVEFREDPEALKLWKDAGADVQGERVHIPKGLCRELMKTAPRQFTQHARNPERTVEIGGKHTVFAPVYGPPFVRDLEGNRRYATIADFRDFVKLAYIAPSMHHSGGTVCEPVDVPVNKRHLDMVYTHIRYSDKPFMGSVTAPERAEDTVKMAQILFGEEFVDKNCVLVSLINCNSPMVMDATMLGALKVYAKANQATVHFALHRRRRHEPGDGGRNADAGALRGDERNRLHAALPKGRAGDLRHVRHVRSRCSRARRPSARRNRRWC